MPKLIVFDLDGTLVDSRLDLAESANELLSVFRAAPIAVDEVSRMVGEGARVLVERVLAARRVERPMREALALFLEIYERRIVEHTRAYPGVEAALDAVRSQAQLAVLTNKPSRHTTLLLDALGLGRHFVAVLGGDSQFPRKPDPSALLHLAGVAGARPASTLMVGDSMVDVETARRARTRMCVVRYGYGHFGDEDPIPAEALVVPSSSALEQVLVEGFLEA
jgi:phosphoglycolate phosphatase